MATDRTGLTDRTDPLGGQTNVLAAMGQVELDHSLTGRVFGREKDEVHSDGISREPSQSYGDVRCSDQFDGQTARVRRVPGQPNRSTILSRRDQGHA